MLERLTRYALLVACLLLAGVWGRNGVRASSATYVTQEMWSIALIQGRLEMQHWNGTAGKNKGFQFGEGRVHRDQPLSARLGLFMPDWGTRTYRTPVPITKRYINIPLWTLLTPLLLITAWQWYPIVRNRLRAKCGTGFPVRADFSRS